MAVHRVCSFFTVARFSLSRTPLLLCLPKRALQQRTHLTVLKRIGFSSTSVSATCSTKETKSATPPRTRNKEKGSTSLSSLKELLYSTRVGSRVLHDESKLDKLVQKTLEEVPSYSVSQLVSLLKCLQKVRFHSFELFESIVTSLTKRSLELSLNDASGIVRMYREQGQTKWANKISHLCIKRLTKALRNGEVIHPRTVANLSEIDIWPPGFDAIFQKYVLTNADRFNFQSLCEILTIMLRKRCTNYDVLKKCAEVAHRHIENNLENIFFSDIGRLFWVYGKCTHYSKDLFHSLVQLLQVDDKYLSSWFVTTVAWSCAKVRFYDPTVMDLLALYSLRHLNGYSFHDMSSLVYSFGSLNHPHRELFDAVTARFVETKSTRGIEQSYWVLVWASMVLEIYDNRVLSLVLNSEFLEASTQISDYKVTQPLQMSVALNKERPDLGFGLSEPPPPDHKWGECFPSMDGVDKKYIQIATTLKVESYRSSDRSRTFVENVLRALGLVIGGTQYINCEAISLSGYIVDFEILLDENDHPILIPNEWKSRPKDIVLKSIGIGNPQPKKSTNRILDANSLIETMKSSEVPTLDQNEIIDDLLLESFRKSDEQDTSKGRRSSYSLASNTCDPVKLVNLASDWGSKFADPQERVSRRIVIEGDGLPHFARNCDHVMGPTVLKHRQLRALGWEVVQVPYTEWRSLRTGDDHAQYLSEKIFRQ